MFEGTFDIVMELDSAKEMSLSFEIVGGGIKVSCVICVVEVWLSVGFNLRLVEVVVRTKSCRSTLVKLPISQKNHGATPS